MSINNQLTNIVGKIDLKMNMAAQEIVKDLKKRLQDAVEELWYDKYPSPIDYTRTYQLIDAVNGKITKNAKGNYTIEIFIDPELMTTNPGLYSWGTHTGFSGEDFRSGLIDSIIHGMRGSKLNPRYGDSANVIEVVQEETTKYANSILKQYLK